MTDQEYISSLIARSRKAQESIADFTQEQVFALARAIGWTTILHAEEWARSNQDETLLGDYQSKFNRLNDRVRGVLRDLSTAKSVGVIERDRSRGLIKIAKPAGVLGAIIPMTAPDVTPVLKAMNGIIGRNSLVYSPHPRGKKTTIMVINALRELMKRMGVSEDLFICIENPTMPLSQELMRQCDLALATGGSGLVKAAYSSGTPAYGVGAGNVVAVIDETADLEDAVDKIVSSQINDLATGCSTENSLLIQEGLYDKVVDIFASRGAYVLSPEDKQKLQNVLWKDLDKLALNIEIIARPAKTIAAAAGITVPEDTQVLLVEESGYGHDYPFSSEKLSPVLTLYKYNTFQDAIDLTNAIQDFKGAGHSCSIHSFDEDHILQFALQTKTVRVTVRQCHGRVNAGAWTNCLPFTTTLGCGTWGGNILSDNLNWRQLINTTWVTESIPANKPSDEEIFGSAMQDPRVI